MKYKLIKEYPGSPKLDTIVKKYKGFNDYRSDDVKSHAFNASIIENSPEYWEKVKPLFYTEDFKDGSFPMKSCNNCTNYGHRNNLDFCYRSLQCGKKYDLWNITKHRRV